VRFAPRLTKYPACNRRTDMDRNSQIGMEDSLDLQRELDRLRADLRQLRNDLSGLGVDGVRAARAGLQETARTAAAKGKAAAEVAEKQIAAHPFLTVASCLAIGVLLGLRMNRRD
jgi:ElaB/YqjD/DUF883 family membrane-anchored ribosome-binding protein